MSCGTDLTIRQAPDLLSAPSLIEPPVTDNRAVLHSEQPVQSAAALFWFKLPVAPQKAREHANWEAWYQDF